MATEPIARSFLVIDIEKSSARSDPEKEVLRRHLYAVFADACRVLPLSSDDGRLALNDRGDGLLAVFDVPVLDLLDPFLDALLDALATRNAKVAAQDWMRLRVGLHFGQVLRDEHGWSGDALTHTFRIVDAPKVKALLGAADRAQAVVVVSDPVHRDFLQHRYRGLSPEAYGAVVDDGRTAWARVPGHVVRPVEEAAPDPARQPSTTSPLVAIGENAEIGNVITTNSLQHLDARTYFSTPGD